LNNNSSNQQNKKNNQGNQNNQGPRFDFGKNRFALFFLLSLIIMFGVILVSNGSTAAQDIPYSTFINYVESDEVQSVEIMDNDEVFFTLKTNNPCFFFTTKKQMLAIAGLGNPGDEYRKTRHNVGFLTLDRLSSRYAADWKKPLLRRLEYAVVSNPCSSERTPEQHESLLLIRPLTFMNRSGDVLPHVIRKFHIGIQSICVVCDNLDIPAGSIRIKKGGGSAGHNGLKSVISVLDSSDFIRVFIGIGRPGKGEDVISHVLGVPDAEEQKLLDQGILRAADALADLRSKPIEQVMNEYNRRNHTA